MKDSVKSHSGTRRWHAARLQPVVKNRGIKNIGKQKKKLVQGEDP